MSLPVQDYALRPFGFRLLVAGLSLLLFSVAAKAAAGPDANLLFQLEKQNRSRPWLRVTTDSGRFRLRSDRLDARGLAGFEAHDKEPLPPDPLSWDELKRLDRIETRSRAYGITGALVLGALAAGLGNALGALGGDGGNDAFLGFVAGGAVGAWAGSSYGDRFQKDVHWYTPPPPATPSELPSIASALADSTRDVTSAIADTVPESPPSAEALKLASTLSANDHLRVSGDFGRFQGHVNVAGPLGLERLVADRHAPNEWKLDPLPERIPWSAIDQVQMPASNAGGTALGVAVGFAVVGALFSASVVSALGDGSTTAGEAALQGGAVCGLIGAVVGAGIGSASHHWAVVYPRR